MRFWGLIPATVLAVILSGIGEPAQAGTRGCFSAKHGVYDASKLLERCGKTIQKAGKKGRGARLAKALLHRAMIHHELGDYDSGLRDIETTLAVAADLGAEQRRRVEIVAHMASAYLHDRRSDETPLIASVDRLIAADTSGMGEAFVLSTLIEVLCERGLHDKAVSLINAALANDPPDALSMTGFSRGVMTRLDLLQARGTFLTKMNRLPEAEADFTEIVKQSDGPISRLARAQIQHKMGNANGALADLKAAMQHKAFDAGTINMVKQIRSLNTGATFSGDPRDPSRYSTADPNDRAIAIYVDVWMLRCELLLDQGRTGEAADDCTRAVENFPDHIVRFDVLERLARAQGRTDDAAHYAEKARARQAEEQARAARKPSAREKSPVADVHRMTVSAQMRSILAGLDGL